MGINRVISRLKKGLDATAPKSKKAWVAVTGRRGRVIESILDDLIVYYCAILRKKGPLRERLQAEESTETKSMNISGKAVEGDDKRFDKYADGIIARVKPMLSGDYQPPEDPHDLRDDLIALRNLYHGYPFGSFADTLSPVVQRTLDVAAIELVYMAGLHLTTMRDIGVGQENRDKANTALIKKKQTQKDKVIQIYFRMDRRALSKNAIAEHIKKEWSRLNDEKPPSINTIKSYLSNEWAQDQLVKTKGFGKPK